MSFPDVINDAGVQYDPSTIANYLIIWQRFSQIYHGVRILKWRPKQLLHPMRIGGSGGKHFFRLLTYWE
ncbi:MAG: hypothetical protein IPO48_20040 [Saprospiraceae bacterium]|nr:hypothetical protein [Saprospiraceae bacterium]